MNVSVGELIRALALDTRIDVSTAKEATYGATSRNSHLGTWRGGGAPNAAAIAV